MEIVLRNGKATSFLFDKWLPNGKSKREPIHGPLMEEEYKIRLGYVYNTLGGGTKTLIYVELPNQILSLIQCTYLNPASNKWDTTVWKPSTKGTLTASSSYRFLMENEHEDQQNLNNPCWIWALKCPNRIKFFLWLFHHYILTTKSYLQYIRMDVSNLCNLCKNPETIEHIFVECSNVRELWRELGDYLQR